MSSRSEANLPYKEVESKVGLTLVVSFSYKIGLTVSYYYFFNTSVQNVQSTTVIFEIHGILHRQYNLYTD